MVLYKSRGLSTYSTTEITEVADATYPSPERVFPSEGLTVEQVGVALKRMGHETVVVNLEKASPQATRRWLYHYIESAIPIVLGVQTRRGRHAITVIGHTLKTSPLLEIPMEELKIGSRLQSLRYHPAAEWVDGLLLHDDQRGSYRIASIPIEETRSTSIEMHDFPVRGRMTKFRLLAAIVPLPHHVYLLGDDAEAKGAILLSLIRSLNLVDSRFAQEGLVLRTFLLESNDFKRSLDTAERELPPLLGWLYQKRHLPKYVWLIEVSTLPLWNIQPSEKRVLGEILIDPTSNPAQLDAIAAHLGGFFWAAEPGDLDIYAMLEREAVSIPDWRPYKCLRRPCS
jgi:hypothetical protein